MHYPLVARRPLAAVARQSELASPRTSGPRACRGCTSRTSACSISIPPDDDRRRAAGGGALGCADLLHRARSCRPSSRRRVRRASTSSFRSTARAGFERSGASRTARAAVLVKRHPERLHPGVHQGRPRGPHLRGHRPQRSRRDVRRRLRREAEARRARVRAVHLAGGRARLVGPRTFTLRTMAARVASVGDIWAEMRRAVRREERWSACGRRGS